MDSKEVRDTLGSKLGSWKTKIPILSCFLIVTIFVFQPAVLAAGVLGVAVTFGPASFTASPGDQLHSYIDIGNIGNVTARITFQCSGEMSKWITFERNSFTLPKAESVRVDVRIGIPIDAFGGTYSGEVSVDAVDDAAYSGGQFGGISHLYNSKTYQIGVSGTPRTATTSTTTRTETTGAATSATTSVVTSATSSLTTTASAETTETVTTGQPSSPPSRCVIATAAYGSDVAPDVVYMRYVRDKLIGSTPTGRGLVDGFNAFYYSWSPSLAERIAGNGLLRAIFRVLLLPLVGIVHITALTFMGMASMTENADVASVVAFVAAAAMTLTIYVVLPVVAATEVKQAARGRLCKRSTSRR